MNRPIGILFLVAWLVLEGTASFLSLADHPTTPSPDIERIGFIGAAPRVVFAVIGSLALASTIGILLRRSWGWWLGATFFAYCVVRELSALIDVASISHRREIPFVVSITSYVKYCVFAGIAGLFEWYLFSQRVYAYFRIELGERSRRLKAIVLIAGVLCLILATTGFLE